MKKYLLLSLAALSAFSFYAFQKGGTMLPLGEKAPMTDYKMQGVQGGSHSLADLKKENGLLVIFSSNTCPFVLAWEEKYPELSQLAQENQVGMVLVNSNTKKRSADDSMEAMRKRFKEGGYKSPYVIDENNQLADAFGAKTTPHVYLFNSDMKLVYRGSINNKFENKSKTADKFYLNEALKALAKGEKINPADTREIGCSIKRV